MPVTTNSNSIANVLNAPLPGAIADYLQQLKFGLMLRQQMPATLRRAVPVVAASNPYIPAGDSIVLPDDAKASMLLRATIVAGGTTGELTFVAYGPAAAPATTTAAVAANGDILFNHATDLPTSVDVTYMPEKQDAYEVPAITPATAVVTIPASLVTQGVVTIMEAEILTGTVTGKCKILKPGAAPGTTLQANLNVAKTQVLFTVADAPTSVRIKFGLVSAVDQNALLETAQYQI